MTYRKAPNPQKTPIGVNPEKKES